MRLADRIIEAAADPLQDRMQCGALAAMAHLLHDAQHFEIGAAMLEAADRVRKIRPSTMIGALPMVRFPYRICWFEWLGADVAGDRDPTPDKPTPQRLGALVVCTDEKLQQGYATWAWSHEGKPVVVCPVGVLFNTAAGDFPALNPSTEAQVRQRMLNAAARFQKLVDDPIEVAACIQLEERTKVSPTPQTAGLFNVLCHVAGGPHALNSALDDLEGEPAFLYAIVILLNSRNVVIRETEDLTRLNRARARQKKHSLLPFIRTDIVLSRVQGRRAGISATAQERRRHLVMGHFKVRATGVFWWSPHPRGSRGEVRRTHYAVEADADLNRDLARAIKERG